MKIINDYDEFEKRTKPLRDLDFALMDITPNFQLGMFLPKRLPELMQFCQANPEYHIISQINVSMKMNKIVGDAGFYMLAQGDADPELIFFRNVKIRTYNNLQVLKFLAGPANP